MHVANLAFMLIVLLLLPTQSVAEDEAGTVVRSYGEVLVSSGTDKRWRQLRSGDSLQAGSVVRTGRLSGASLRLHDESLIRLSQNTQFEIQQIQISSFWRRATSLVKSLNRGVKSSYRLISGKLWGRNNNRNRNTEISTLTATIGIRGTEYSIEADQQRSVVTIQEGAVLAQNEFGQTTIHSGEQAVVRAGQAPQKSALVTSGESVQWTVLIPEMVGFRSYLKNGLQNKKAAAEIYDAYQLENYADAMAIIAAELENDANNLDLRLVQAWIRIQAAESASAYNQLRDLAQNNPEHVRLQELTAFAAFLNGQTEHATSVLSALKERSAITDAGWLIQGYLHQAGYDLPAASQAYARALEMNPQNQPARIQLATLYFGSEQTQRAARLVAQALAQQPDYQPALSLQGFLRLADNDNLAAISSWEKSLTGAPRNGEAYFGMSLAHMRMGNIEPAMQHIATAVLLEPQRSMYLSYWGKMLHQIGRYDKALTVLDSAIRLDGNDPTPRLYKAIILRDINRPGEAIQNIQAAVKLNDNRGVYRSRSLLDKDLAVQNVDLSRLFTQLGLAEWAHKKAIASIKSDFSNASAHILNAGAYAEQGDRTYALANEALLARMLQPANINAFSSFNNYTSLYESPDTQFDLIAEAGNHQQQGLSLIAAGAVPERRVAWGFIAAHDASDGWRDSNGETTDALALLAKWQPSQRNNFMFTLSSTELEQKDDLFPRYEIDSTPDPLARFEFASLQLELGLHHKLALDHDLLFYLSLTDAEGDITDNPPFDASLGDASLIFNGETVTRERVASSDFDRPNQLIQFQGIKKLNQHQIIYGALFFDGKSKSVNTVEQVLFDANHDLLASGIGTPPTVASNLDTRLTSVHVQDSWALTPTLTLDIAAYIEEMDNANAITGGEWTVDETTGRLGLVWQASERNTFRVAAFEYLVPFTIARLDPTDIAGIAIFKNSNEGSLVEEADLVWDYEWTNGIVSTTLFTLDESFTSAVPDTNGIQQQSTSTAEKEGVLITLNALLGSKTGISAGIAGFDVEDQSLQDYNRSEQGVAFGITHVVGNGLSLSANHVIRDIEFDNARADESLNVTNVKVGYEFPGKRHNLVFEVFNLADEKFNWVTDRFTTLGIAPERMLSLRYRLSF